MSIRTVVRDARYQAACVTNLAQGWTSFGVPVITRPRVGRGTAASPSVVDRYRVRLRIRGADDRSRTGWSIRRHGGPSACHDSGWHRRGGIHHGGSVRTEHLAVDHCALRYGIASAFLGTAPAAAVGDAAGSQGGTAVALFSMCSDIGAIIGPLVAGLLADRLSYPAAFAAGAVLMLLAAGLSWRMPRERAAGSAESGVGWGWVGWGWVG